ncbi:MAG: hypothetical protein L3K19_03690 [Thermoplasmata archaeon]|nr:hypothetical protein [Thermoplasmata archaeon]
MPAGGPCPTCGKHPVAPGGPAQVRRQRRWSRTVGTLRIALVIVVVLGLSWALISAVYTGPPVYSDPLTTQGSYHLTPGHFTVLSGAITGEDYIVGNYTVTDPVGAAIALNVYNSTSFGEFERGQAATPQWSVTGEPAGRIVFAAPYTDTFYFVFENPYLSTSGINETLFAATQYQSNVVIG